MRFSIYQDSKTGGRKINQDRMGYLYTRDSLLLMVADGMGGHARGEIAAQLTLQTVAAMYQKHAKPLLPDPARFLHDAVLASHQELHRYRAEQHLPEAPRTTIVMCVVQKGFATWVHVGDSRLYLVRGDVIAGRTIDHSRVNYLLAAGLIRPEDVKTHPERNRIFNCLGAFVAPTIDIADPVALQSGDVLLLCTDGLWGGITDEAIIQGFHGRSVMRAVPELMDSALAENGPDADNCTALAMAWAGIEAVDMLPEDDSPLSTLDLPEGAMTSTVQMPLAGDDPAPSYTDDEIDDAVSEIQQAIQRASKLLSDKT
jgi:protein phosphatase